MYYYNEFPCYKTSLNREMKNNLKLQGEGSIKVSPDTAVIFLGVISESKKLADAQDENNEKISRVIEAILKTGINEKDIKTENYSVDPQYDFVEGKQIFRGYRVTNNIRVTVKDMKSIGSVIDTAIENGANVVYNVNFALANREVYYKKALSLAIINAVEKAESIEKTLDVEVDTTPVSIVEENPGDFQPRELYSIKAPASPTPIMTGQIEITAKIAAEFRYSSV